MFLWNIGYVCRNNRVFFPLRCEMLLSCSTVARNMECELVSLQATQTDMPQKCNDIEDKNQCKRTGLFHLLKTGSVEFCRSTSLHGVQYIGDKNRNVTERWGYWWTELINNTRHFLNVWNRLKKNYLALMDLTSSLPSSKESALPNQLHLFHTFTTYSSKFHFKTILFYIPMSYSLLIS